MLTVAFGNTAKILMDGVSGIFKTIYPSIPTHNNLIQNLPIQVA